MGIRQFLISVRLILGNRHVNRPVAIARHFVWQFKKIANAFPFTQTISKSKIVAFHKGCGVSALIWNQGLYDYNNMRFLQHLLKEGGVFIDVGANIGSYTLIASEQPLAIVHAFEPHPNTFERLKENVEINKRMNVQLHNCALGSEEGEVAMTDLSASAINHLITDDISADKLVRVRCCRLERICRDLDLKPDFVKVDVEGYEYAVIAGFGIEIDAIKMVMVEMNGLADLRSKGQSDIHATLVNANFSGPWLCNFDERKFVLRRTRGREDSIYVSGTFKRYLESMEFKFSAI